MKVQYGLFCGDFHCGHRVGLTPPEWQNKLIINSTSSVNKRNKFYRAANDLWKHFESILKQLPPLDFVVVNGDCVDGKGKKSGGTEQLTTSMIEQCDMAASVIKKIQMRCKPGYKLIMTYGTNYHVGNDGDDCENIIADKVQADRIGAHEWIDVNGTIFDIKHKVGNSQVPHGRFTALAKAGLWNKIWALDEKLQPNAHVLIRSHVHSYRFMGTSNQLCMSLPALQGMGSKFGSRECEGTVDWGMVLFTIRGKGDYDWTPFIHKVTSQKVRAYKI
jgi:hypothetical protein